MKFKPFPEIHTERLILRKIETSDCDAILFLRSDETVNKYIARPENRKTKNLSDAVKFIKELNGYLETGKSIAWGITMKNNPEIVGTICLWNFSNDNKTAEVGYDLHPEFQGKGIMDESLKLIIEYGFGKLKLTKIEAFTHTINVNSRKLLVKNEFQLIENRKDPDNKSNVIFELDNISVQQFLETRS